MLRTGCLSSTYNSTLDWRTRAEDANVAKLARLTRQLITAAVFSRPTVSTNTAAVDCQTRSFRSIGVLGSRSRLLSRILHSYSRKSTSRHCLTYINNLTMVSVIYAPPSLDSFRPVSNLAFLSKLLERVVQCRLQVFLDSNDMMPPMQSAYRRFHIY